MQMTGSNSVNKKNARESSGKADGKNRLATGTSRKQVLLSSAGLQWCLYTTEATPSVQLPLAVGSAGLPRYPHQHCSESTGNLIQPDPKSTPFLPGTP